MKMKQLLVVMVAVLLMVGSAACSNDNENDLVESYVKPTSKDIFPDWLVDIIDSWEASEPQIAAVYSVEWKGKQIYYIYNLLQSSLFTQVYNADGTPAGIEDYNDFIDNITEWRLVYCTDSFYNIFQERIRGNFQK